MNKSMLKNNITKFSIRAIRGALKLRYLVLGGAIIGGMNLKKIRRVERRSTKYEMVARMPENEQWTRYSQSLVALRDSVRDSIEKDPRLKEFTEEKLAMWRDWFYNRFENAIEAADSQKNEEKEIESTFKR